MTEADAVPAGAIVVGHDGSPHADRALASGIRFAELFHAPLVVVRAWQLDADVPPYTRVLAADPNDIVKVVDNGVPGRNNYVAMPAFKIQLTDEQVADIANYIRTSWGNGAAPNATSPLVARLRAGN